MIEREIRSLLARPDFLPFRIRLLSGDYYDVAYRESVAALEDGLFIAQADGHWVQFPYLHVASLESLFEGEF